MVRVEDPVPAAAVRGHSLKGGESLRGYAAQMAFTLHTPVGPQSYSEGAHWSMNQKGLLVVQTDDDRLLTFSPSGWYWLEEARSLGAAADVRGSRP